MDDTRGKIAVCTYQPPTCQYLNCKPSPQPSHNKPDHRPSNSIACDTYWLPCSGGSTDKFSKYPKARFHLAILLKEVTTLVLQYWIDLEKTIQAHVLLHIQSSLMSQRCPMPWGSSVLVWWYTPAVLLIIHYRLYLQSLWCSWCCWCCGVHDVHGFHCVHGVHGVVNEGDRQQAEAISCATVPMLGSTFYLHTTPTLQLQNVNGVFKVGDYSVCNTTKRGQRWMVLRAQCKNIEWK